jgi:hypothetical protein
MPSKRCHGKKCDALGARRYMIPGLDKFTLTADELRTKFASGEWRLLEGSIPE